MNDIELFNEGMKMIDVDTTKAFEYFSKSAEAGNADAMYYLGLIYELGDGAEMNVNKALEWFEKARAAHDDIIDSMFPLSGTYLFGTDKIPINYRLAAYWALRGLESGHTKCWYLIAIMYEHGMFFEKNLAYAKYCYKQALPDMEAAKTELNDRRYLLVVPRKPNLMKFDDTTEDFFADELPPELDEQARAIIFEK